MRLRRPLPIVVLGACAALGACQGGADAGTATDTADAATGAPAPAEPGGPAAPRPSAGGAGAAAASTGSAAASTGPDLTRLPLGDGRISTAPESGSVYACQAQFGPAPGALRDGPWIRADGTFDLTAKVTVDGAVPWPGRFGTERSGEVRVLTANGVPANHPAGQFPIEPADDAYAFDPNPNPVAERDLRIEVPAEPVPAAQPSCLPMGPIGITISGVVLFNALDARGLDAVAHELQDSCDGHPAPGGDYHYHSLTGCIPDAGGGHSTLVGYAFDGFGLFGKRGEGGATLTNEGLDACHGHTHPIPWDGQTRELYHYHATWEYPYTVGCYQGTPSPRRGPR